MKTWLSWSSGKDSAWSLEVLRGAGAEVAPLFTTLNAAFDRVAMHAVRRALLEAQARAARLDLHIIELPYPCPNADYERIMGAFVAEARAEGVEAMAFGDLFLADIRAYRERQLAGTGIAPVFPLWGRDTPALAREMIYGGLEAHVTCVDPGKLDRTFAGRIFDHAFLADLPAGVDPCGENGEFHTFVSAGPMFGAPIAVRPGDVTERDGFVFADLLPAARSDGCNGVRPPDPLIPARPCSDTRLPQLASCPSCWRPGMKAGIHDTAPNTGGKLRGSPPSRG